MSVAPNQEIGTKTEVDRNRCDRGSILDTKRRVSLAHMAGQFLPHALQIHGAVVDSDQVRVSPLNHLLRLHGPSETRIQHLRSAQRKTAIGLLPVAPLIRAMTSYRFPSLMFSALLGRCGYRSCSCSLKNAFPRFSRVSASCVIGAQSTCRTSSLRLYPAANIAPANPGLSRITVAGIPRLYQLQTRCTENP